MSRSQPRTALREFLATEVAGGVVLLATTAIALIWANSPSSWPGPAPDSYERLWNGDLDLRHWVNDGLMSVFFLVVGLEVKRELVQGELADRRRAVLPVVAALGGIVVPALLYAAVNAGALDGGAPSGWGIPMATDIAFALGVLALVAPGVPSSLRVFLLALAIVDDIGAIVVIALFYASPGTGVGIGGVGVHPTIVAVIVGLLVPRGQRLEQLERLLHPLSSFFIVPVFALANAGVVLSGDQIVRAVDSPVTLGIVLGLVMGKMLGITGAAWLACRTGLAALPTDVGWRHLFGVAALGGIGFTVSLFVTDLAFDSSSAVASEAKVGILAASLLASLTGALILRRTPSFRRSRRAEGRPSPAHQAGPRRSGRSSSSSSRRAEALRSLRLVSCSSTSVCKR